MTTASVALTGEDWAAIADALHSAIDDVGDTLGDKYERSHYEFADLLAMRRKQRRWQRLLNVIEASAKEDE